MKLIDIVKIKGGKRLPKGENLQKTKNTHPYIRVRDLSDKYISPSDLEYVPDDVFPKIKNYIVNENDVLISIVGTIGLVSIIDKNLDGASQTENCAKLSGLNKVDAQYLYYFLISELGQNEIRKGTVGAVQPKLPLYAIENIEIDWKTEDKRAEIVTLLSTLDEKIQLNTQINQTLEQIAQTIFKSWFIDFDPVRAKAAALSDGSSPEQATLAAMQTLSGKTAAELTAYQTEHPEAYQQLHHLAQTFPSEFEEIDGVEVPKGWGIPYLKDVCNIVYGKGLPKTKLLSEGYDVFGANGVIGYYSEYMYEKPQVLVGCRGTVGQVTISLPYSFITNNSLIIEYENSPFCLSYLEQYLKTINLKEVSSGSVQPQITIQNMSGVKILKPTEEILKFFDSKVEYIYELKLKNYFQNKNLAEVRDLLLPKLLSGEVELC